MDLIYIILSVFLRFSTTVLKLSNQPKSGRHRKNDLTELAVWLPVVGWVSVLVKHIPESFWLEWRVIDIRSFDRVSLDQKPKQRLGDRLRNRGVPDPHDHPRSD